jgi:hypothetical protein
MSEDIKFGLSDLDINDDLDVSLDNDTYQDQANPAPVPFGDYLLKLLADDGQKQRDSITPAIIRSGEKKGTPVTRKVNGVEYPVFQLNTLEIIDGLGEGKTRKVSLFQEINTSSYERDGHNVSQIGDLARALGLGNFRGLGELLPMLIEAQQSGATFGATLDWQSGYDKEFVTAAMEQLELPVNDKGYFDYKSATDEQKKLNYTIQRYARVEGMRNFPFNVATQKFSHVMQRGNVTITDPNTKNKLTIEVPQRTLSEARSIIKVDFRDLKFIPRERVESGRVAFGPRTVKPATAPAVAA